jgi:hypothetical protein
MFFLLPCLYTCVYIPVLQRGLLVAACILTLSGEMHVIAARTLYSIQGDTVAREGRIHANVLLPQFRSPLLSIHPST